MFNVWLFFQFVSLLLSLFTHMETFSWKPTDTQHVQYTVVITSVVFSMDTFLTNYMYFDPPPPPHKHLYSFDLPCPDQQFVDQSFFFILFIQSLYSTNI